MNFIPYLLLLRPRHWVKNLIVFVPVFFASEIFVPGKMLLSLYAFILFCLLTSSMYIVNDIIDRKRDAQHPHKKSRPIASGVISVSRGVCMLIVLVSVMAFGLYFFIPAIASVVAGYFVMSLLYSLFLKNVVIFDILSIPVFYLLRVLGGGLATDTPISRWLILCLVFVTLFVVLGKRKAEFRLETKRDVLHQYTTELLNHFLSIAVALTLVSYGLYSVLAVQSERMVYSIFFVLLGVFRYLFLIYTSSDGVEFPEKILFTDTVVLLSIIAWLGFSYYIFYL